MKNRMIASLILVASIFVCHGKSRVTSLKKIPTLINFTVRNLMSDSVRFEAFSDRVKIKDFQVPVGYKMDFFPQPVSKIKVTHKKKAKTITGKFGGEIVIYPDATGEMSVLVAPVGWQSLSGEQLNAVEKSTPGMSEKIKQSQREQSEQYTKWD